MQLEWDEGVYVSLWCDNNLRGAVVRGVEWMTVGWHVCRFWCVVHEWCVWCGVMSKVI